MAGFEFRQSGLGSLKLRAWVLGAWSLPISVFFASPEPKHSKPKTLNPKQTPRPKPEIPTARLGGRAHGRPAQGALEKSRMSTWRRGAYGGERGREPHPKKFEKEAHSTITKGSGKNRVWNQQERSWTLLARGLYSMLTGTLPTGMVQ